ncbi:hypothetical protein BC835DRAFT_1310324, partial [Cytidiella melzeri]
MPAPTTSDWLTRGIYDWHTTNGIAQLQKQLQPKLLWDPKVDFQLKPSAKLMMGEHGLVISATCDGKSAIFYTYLLMRPDTMTIVVVPKNALEDDMVRNLAKLNISAIALNSKALESTTLANIHLPTAERRDLWKDAREGQYRILLMSPEMLQTKSFRIFIENANVREHLALFVVDE